MQSIAATASPTFAGLTLTGLSGLISASAGVLQNTTYSSTTGITASFATSVLTINTSQDLRSTSSPTFVGATLSGASGLTLATFSSTKGLQSTTLVGSNGITSSISGSTMTIATPQDIQTTASPTFAGLTFSGAVPYAPMYIGAAKAVTTTAAASTNGQLLIGTTSGAPVAATLTAGANITITNTAGAITIANAGLVTTGVLVYQTGTIAQTAATVTGTGTTFTSAMVGGLFISAGSAATTIKTFVSTTSITVAKATTVAAGTSYTIYYQAANGSFAVSSNGNIYHGIQNTYGAATTCEYWQLQNGNSTMAFDYQTYSGSANAPNARMTIEDNGAASTNWKWWSRISGADTNSLQLNFTIGADRSVRTANCTLDDGGGNAIFGNIGTSNLSASGSISTTNSVLDDGTGAMRIGNDSPLTWSGAFNAPKIRMDWTAGIGIRIRDMYNGSNTWLSQVNGVTGSISTLYNQLDDGKGNMAVAGTLGVTGTLTASQIIDSGLTGNKLLCSNSSNQLQSVTLSTLSGGNGSNCSLSFSGNALTFISGNTQDVSATGSPTFATETLTTGLMLPTAGGVPTLLNYYETYSYTTTFTGCGTTTSAVVVQIIQIGRLVTLCTNLDANFTAASSGQMTLTTAFPSRFGVVTNHKHFQVSTQNNGTQNIGDAYISISNGINCSATPIGGAFTGGSCVLYRFSTSWFV